MTQPESSDAFVTAFDHGGVTRTRHAVAAWAKRSGLLGQRLEGFVLAVNEIVTNAVRHGAGSGRLRLWAQTGVLWCEVHDQGTVEGPEKHDGYELPSTDDPGGRGLWLARHLCDLLTFDSSGTGTTVRLAIFL